MSQLPELFPGGLEPLLSAMAQRFAGEQAEDAVELLVSARPSLVHVRSDARRGDLYCLGLLVPQPILDRLGRGAAALERDLLSCARGLLPKALAGKLDAVSLGPLLASEQGWREGLRRRKDAAAQQKKARVVPARLGPPPPRPSVEIAVRHSAAPLPVEERAPKELRQLEAALKEKKAERGRRYKSFRVP